MDLWVPAVLGVILLVGSFASNSFIKKTAAPIYKYLTVTLGVLSAICFFYYISTLLLIAGID